MTRGEYGRWELTLPARDGQLAIPHGSKVKVGSTIGFNMLQPLTYEHRSPWSYLPHMNAWSEYRHGSLASLRT